MCVCVGPRMSTDMGADTGDSGGELAQGGPTDTTGEAEMLSPHSLQSPTSSKIAASRPQLLKALKEEPQRSLPGPQDVTPPQMMALPARTIPAAVGAPPLETTVR